MRRSQQVENKFDKNKLIIKLNSINDNNGNTTERGYSKNAHFLQSPEPSSRYSNGGYGTAQVSRLPQINVISPTDRLPALKLPPIT